MPEVRLVILIDTSGSMADREGDRRKNYILANVLPRAGVIGFSSVPL